MRRILVVPERLDALSADLGRAGGDLEQMQGALARAMSLLEWDGLTRSFVEDGVQEAYRRGAVMAEQAGVMARFLQTKAEAFRAADGAGTAVDNPGHQGALDAIRRWIEAERKHPWFTPAVVLPLWGLGSLVGVLPPFPILRKPGWIFGKQSTEAPPATQPAEPPAQPAQPASPPAAPGDAFWDSIAQPPLVSDENGLHFTPEFQAWVDKFNGSVRGNWAKKSTDYSGTSGADNLINTYLLTPEKVKELWETARENHVDPRLLLAILKQEGTGSFNTNPVNSEHFKGHGPQPNFSTDLNSALDGPICSKLRLYGAAVQGGFKGSFIDWVNWYTPIDSKGFQGSPGVYAADINWGAGVARNYRQIAASMGGGSGDAVAQYSQWMGDHSDLFRPKFIDGDFVIKQGLPPGAKRPSLAVWGESPQPFSNAENDGTWWWFPAPDEYCWHIERK